MTETRKHPYTNDEGIERLTLLRNLLEERVPDKLLRMTKWTNKKDTEPCIECKTAGCAIGWACTFPEFKKMGLKFHFSNWNRELIPTYDTWTGPVAVCDFFHISYQVFNYLFMRDQYQQAPKVSHVVERIDKIIKGEFVGIYTTTHTEQGDVW